MTAERHKEKNSKSCSGLNRAYKPLKLLESFWGTNSWEQRGPQLMELAKGRLETRGEPPAGPPRVCGVERAVRRERENRS